jgi:hypothetical protein
LWVGRYDDDWNTCNVWRMQKRLQKEGRLVLVVGGAFEFGFEIEFAPELTSTKVQCWVVASHSWIVGNEKQLYLVNFGPSC